VRLPAHKATKRKGKIKPKPGALVASVGCDRAAKVTLTGLLTELLGKKPKHGKQRSKRYKLGPVSGSTVAEVPLAVTLKLPTAATAGLEHKRKELIAFTLVASAA
jgi:hypothetical protein